MSTKLRDLIRGVRGCKTAAEERALVQKEKALVRNSFTQQEGEEGEYRARNIAKLLFIHLLGHDTDFGQLECLKLITSSNYTDKKIGYLGLTQLFSEKSEVLMMSTNRIRLDLQSGHNYVVALALQSLSEITTADMCRELGPEVAKLMMNGNTYIKKKAALAATRIIKRVPELIDDFVDRVGPLLEERHHGVMLATLALVEDILTINIIHKKTFKKHLTLLIKVLKSLVSNYTAEYDISGVIDPFLQVQILKVFGMMAKGDEAMSDEISEVLALVATNTPSNKNTGNSVLFECVKTILTIESSNTLKTLAINILGKFLANKENNSKYVSLVSLQRVVRFDPAAVQKHKNTILDCLRENDISIKKHALNLLSEIVNESNVKSIVMEMLNYLLVSETDFLQELTLKICVCVEKYSPNRRWHIDVIIRVLTLAGRYVKDESINNLLHMIASTPELHSYCVHKLYFSVAENMTQDGLVKVGLWCIGEYGVDLVSGRNKGPDGKTIVVREDEVMGLIEKILNRVNVSESIKEFALNCLIKLYPNYKNSRDKIKDLIDSQTTSAFLEVQQRACEYLQLLESEWDTVRARIVEKMPVCNTVVKEFSEKPVGDKEIDEIPPQTKGPKSPKKPDATAKANQLDMRKEVDLIDLDLMGDSIAVEQSPVANNNTQTGLNVTGKSSDLFDLDFGGAPSQPTTTTNPNNIMDMYGASNTSGNTSGGASFMDLGSAFGSTTSANTTTNFLDNFGMSGQTQPVGGFNVSNNNPPSTSQPSSGFDFISDLDSINQSGTSSNKSLDFNAFDDGNLVVSFKCTKDNHDTTNINTTFDNNTTSQITDLVFQVAVQKHLKLTLNPLSGTKLPAHTKSAVTQSMKIANTKQGEKGIVLKLKLIYKLNDQSITRDATINQFPQDY